MACLRGVATLPRAAILDSSSVQTRQGRCVSAGSLTARVVQRCADRGAASQRRGAASQRGAVPTVSGGAWATGEVPESAGQPAGNHRALVSWSERGNRLGSARAGPDS